MRNFPLILVAAMLCLVGGCDAYQTRWIAQQSAHNAVELVTCNYDVGDLFSLDASLDIESSKQAQREKLVQALVENVATDSWKQPAVRIQIHDETLTVTQTPANQQRLEQLLTRIRKILVPQIRIDARLIFPSEAFSPPDTLDNAQFTLLMHGVKESELIVFPTQRAYKGKTFTLSHADEKNPGRKLTATMRITPSPDYRYVAVSGVVTGTLGQKEIRKPFASQETARISVPDGNAILIPLDETTKHAYLLVRFKNVLFDDDDEDAAACGHHHVQPFPAAK